MTLITRIWDENHVMMAGDRQVNRTNGVPIPNKHTCKIIFLKDLNAVLGVSGVLCEKDYNFKRKLKSIYEENSFSSLKEYLDTVKDHFEDSKPSLEPTTSESSLLMASSVEDGEVFNYTLDIKFDQGEFSNCIYRRIEIIKNWYNYTISYIVNKNIECMDDFIDPFLNIDLNINYGGGTENQLQFKQEIYSIINSLKSHNFPKKDQFGITDKESVVNLMQEVNKVVRDFGNGEYPIGIIKRFWTIGKCNGIVLLSGEDQNSSGFIYQDGKCGNDHIW